MPLIDSSKRELFSSSFPGRAWLLPVIGGIAYACAFPPVRCWPLIFLAWVPLWLILSEESAPGYKFISWRRTFTLGWVMGAVGFAIHLHWLLAVSNEDVNIPGLMIPALALLSLYLGIFYGLATLISRYLHHKCGLPLYVATPILLLLFDYLRSLGPLGFPWGLPAYALAPIPELIQVTAFAGVWGLCFIILAVNALIASGKRWGLFLALVSLILLWTTGSRQLSDSATVTSDTHTGADSLSVLVLQPDIRRDIKWIPEKRDEVVDLVFAHAEKTLSAIDDTENFDLFIWPETVFPLRLFSVPPVLDRVHALTKSIDQPILIGTQEGYWAGPLNDRQWIAHNSAFIINPDGSHSQPYRKTRLVPFSERMPLQKILPWLTRIDFGQSNFYPGEGGHLLAVDQTNIGCLICFESAFTEPARDFVRAGADLLILITNDFWFGSSAGPIQHADLCIFRAVENRISLVRCANTGVSFLVDPFGRVTHQLGFFQQGAIIGSVQSGGGSFASRFPDWLIKVLAGCLAAVSLIGWHRTCLANRRQKSEEISHE